MLFVQIIVKAIIVLVIPIAVVEQLQCESNSVVNSS